MSTSPPFLHVLDTDGKRVYARIGRGDGPHEIRFPWNIAQGRLPGEFLILDVGRRQLVPVAANGDVGDPTVMRFSNVPILADILENTYGVPRAVYPVTDGIIMGDVVEVVSSSRGCVHSC